MIMWKKKNKEVTESDKTGSKESRSFAGECRTPDLNKAAAVVRATLSSSDSECDVLVFYLGKAKVD